MAKVLTAVWHWKDEEGRMLEDVRRLGRDLGYDHNAFFAILSLLDQ